MTTLITRSSQASTTTHLAVPPNLRQQTFNRRDVIPLQPNCLWKIEQGIVRTTTWGESGALTTLGYWGTGDVVGRPLSQTDPYQIECLTNVKASILPLHLWYQALTAVLRHIQQVEELLNIVHSKPAQRCLTQFLLWLAAKFGCEVNQGKLITLRLTHQEIAETLGMTRVTVTRLLNQFERDGMIQRYRQRLIVLYPLSLFTGS